jgi:hypothetical protein
MVLKYMYISGAYMDIFPWNIEWLQIVTIEVIRKKTSY